jgi:phosphoglycerol geranylgeranyltransferase
MTHRIYSSFQEAKLNRKKKFAVLIDPDKMRLSHLERVLDVAIRAKADYFFVGGSLVVNDMMDVCLDAIKDSTNIPSVLFPGSPSQINEKADALLFLSLISGRNPDLLIGQHVLAAPRLRDSSLEIISTGYTLVDGGTPTTASYVSGTFPIPADKPEIAYCTALAGEMLGLKTIYLDAGSGAKNPISEAMILMVSQALNVPLIVGGGMRSPEKVAANARAGADIIVVGNAVEKNPELIFEMAHAIREVSLEKNSGSIKH